MLADDHEVVLDSLAMMISSLPGIQVVATVADGHAALDRLQQQSVDIVLSDMHMPGLNGVELALRMREQYPAVKIVLLTMEEEPETIRLAMQAGVWGDVLKRASRKELEAAIHCVADGGRYFSEEVSRQPVSYTHLDVYKRQLPGCIGVKRFSGLLYLLASFPKFAITPKLLHMVR